MSSVRYPDKNPCWYLWEHRDGKVYLLSTSTEEWLAKLHKETTIKIYEISNQTINVDYRLHIERSELNHLYGRRNR